MSVCMCLFRMANVDARFRHIGCDKCEFERREINGQVMRFGCDTVLDNLLRLTNTNLSHFWGNYRLHMKVARDSFWSTRKWKYAKKDNRLAKRINCNGDVKTWRLHSNELHIQNVFAGNFVCMRALVRVHTNFGILPNNLVDLIGFSDFVRNNR